MNIKSLIPVVLLVSIPALAGSGHQHAIEELVITSGSSQRALSEVAQPVYVLDTAELQKQHGDTLGSLLANTPGVANSSFGPGVGRPVLRGMSANRVRVMINGNDAADVSAMSSDHAAMSEPVDARRVEIIHGPGTLVYGGGAIGGIVNVLDSRIHSQPLYGFSGTAGLRFSSADKGRQARAALDAGGGPWVLHMDGFVRRSDDYLAAGDAAEMIRIANSDTRAEGGSVALSLADSERGHLGLAVSQLDYDYAVPNDEQEDVRIAPEKTRYELTASLRDLSRWLAEWRIDFADNDYRHRERHDDVTVGLFDKQGQELKTLIDLHLSDNWQGKLGLHVVSTDLALCHDHDGCSAIPDYSYLPWDGSQGVNFVLLDGYAFVHDTPMPLTETRDMALFAVQEFYWAQGIIEFGLRVEERRIASDPSSIRPAGRQPADYYDTRRFHPATLMLAGTWAPLPRHKFGVSLARAQRAPDAEEMLWNGPHHATFSYQLDNPDLDLETARTLDLTWSYYGDTVDGHVALFYYDFDGFIYNDLKAVSDPYHGLPVYRHEQDDTRLAGFEASLRLPLEQLAEGTAFSVFADHVRARLTGRHEDLPRTPPASAGLALERHNGPWFSRVDVRHFAAQRRVADNETASGSYTTVNAQIAWQQAPWQLAVKGYNLGNTAGLNHVSYLKEQAPIMGRNIVLELNVAF